MLALRANERAQWVKALAAKPANRTLISVKGENQLPHDCLLTSTCSVAQPPTHIMHSTYSNTNVT